MLIRALIAAAGAVALAACATPTPYQAADGTRYGYSEQRIESDRYRVSFSGNSLTDRETVETYLLLRAAELTLQNGEESFRVIQRATDEDTRLTSDPNFYYGGVFPTRFRYYHPAYGWYGPYDPFFSQVDIREITRYEASAEVKFGAGPNPGADNVFNARDVQRNLSGQVARPQ